MQSKLFSLIIISNLSFFGVSQIIGGSGNSEMTPKEAEPSSLSAGSFGGQVNTVNGGFNSSISLGTVSTPGGISFSLSLSHSSSFSVGSTQPMTEGIPYGTGWGPNVPTISMETDVLQKFTCTELGTDGSDYDNLLNYYQTPLGQRTIRGEDQGDLYWFSPVVNIPGVGSSRAIFKYIDAKDDNCMVFVLNKFEKPVELRFYGSRWKITLQDGTVYSMNVHLANYRAPSNDRIIHYDQSNIINGSDLNTVVTAAQDAVSTPYGTYGEGVQNVIQPKKSYSVWYCSSITNPNIPLQGVLFEYEKYGKFNFFKEFEQEQYGHVKADVFVSSTLASVSNFEAYRDVILTKVSSYVHESKIDIIDLEFKTKNHLANNDVILDPSHPDVTQVSNLYNKSIEKSWGVNGDNFSSWTRYVHQKRNSASTNIPAHNPYLDVNGNYITESAGSSNEAAFNHGFLESQRLFNNGDKVYPGDLYEINTVISRNDASATDNGNGTVDLALVTGTLGNNPNNESFNLSGGGGASSNQTMFENEKGVELFSTFNRAMKWSMGYGQAQLETSNLFVMPNYPSSYQGLNIQIGPGNSDINYASDPGVNPNLIDNNGEVNAIEAYPFKEGLNINPHREITSTATISHNFGTGHPWSMMIPVYNMMALNSSSISGAPYDPSDLYDTWWSLENGSPSHSHSNIPTKFDQNVKLEKVELLRYSKNAYMLDAVKVYKVNGEYASTESNNNELKLVSQKKFEHSKREAQTIKNYDYDEFETLLLEPLHKRKRIIILLDKVRDIPVSGDVSAANYGVADTSRVKTTFLGYTKLLDIQSGGSVYSTSLPFVGVTKYVLNRYVDPLGGITQVQYYPVEPLSPSWATVDYTRYNSCGAQSIPRQPMSNRQSFTVHPVVEYLAKDNSTNDLPTNASLENSTAQVRHYQYHIDNRMTFSQSLKPRSIRDNLDYFRGDFRGRTDIAFKEVTVEGPKLSSGERTKTIYEYHGNIDQTLTIDEYMFFGKPKRVTAYDVNGVLESEKLYEYGYTQAFSNGRNRPSPVKENITYHNQVYNSYEYEDIYLDEQVNPYSVTSDPIYGSGESNELPKFIEYHFYDELTQVLPEYMFESYFIKTESITERTYEAGLSKGLSFDPAPADPVFYPLDNPHGDGLINKIGYKKNELDAHINFINSQEEQRVYDYLITNSPLGDTLLTYLIKNSTISSETIAKILEYQRGLTNNVFKHLIDNRILYKTTSMLRIIDQQPYFADDIHSYLIVNLTKRDDYKVVEAILVRNSYLSTDIIEELALSNLLPASIFESVISKQKQQPYQTIGLIIASANTSSSNLELILKNQQVNDSIYKTIVNDSRFDNEVITSVIEDNKKVPSDEVLELILQQSNPISKNQATRIFAKISRPVGITVANLLHQLFEPVFVDSLLGNQLDYYCDNDLIEGRLYIENKKEFEYWEADYRGKAVGSAFELLLGFISSTEEASPFPMTIDISRHSTEDTKTINAIYLKHEPSWQVFSVKSTSPHQPGMYQKQESFYLYDLQNKYDRHWYLHDLNSVNIDVEYFLENDHGQLYGGNDTIAVNFNYFPQTNEIFPHTPHFDGLEKSRLYKNRVLSYQQSSFSKNSRSEKPVMVSKYFRHDSRWSFESNMTQGDDEYFDGDPCSTPEPNDCQEIECTNCYEIYPSGGQTYDDLVPVGYCLWYTTDGQFVCPEGVDLYEHGFDPSAAQMEWCNDGTTSSSGDGTKMMPIPDILSKTLQLRAEYVQLDTLDFSADQEFDAQKWDAKNKYVAEFFLDWDYNGTDEYGFEEPYKLVLPFENMRTNHILERNNYFQVTLEENQIGLEMKYYYNSPKRIKRINSNCSSDTYFVTVNEDIGLPVRVCVGYNKLDSLSTGYEYNDVGQIQKISSPDGQTLSYEYDDYYRLIKNIANGTRQLNQYEYSYWNHDFNKTFDQRTDENFVKTTVFNDDITIPGNELDQEIQKGFIDPLGREHSKVSAYLTSSNDRTEIHSGTVEYDGWNRKYKKYKNYVVNNNASNAIDKMVQTSTPFEEVVFEKSPKSRPNRSSNYGVDVLADHAIKNDYFITNYIFTSCELELSKYELDLIMRSSAINSFRFFRNITRDQDDKTTISYTNAVGQKVATLQYDENNDKVVTLFVYDDYGNLTKTINPEKQESDYIYNSLGLLVEEKNVDAGSTKFMYNKQGLVSHVRNEQTNDYETDVVKRYTRKMHYDDFGKLIKVERRDINEDNEFNGEIYDGFYYEDELVGYGVDQPITTSLTPSGQFYFEYKYSNSSSLDWLNEYKIWWSTIGGGGNPTWEIIDQNQLSLTQQSGPVGEKSFSYGDDVNTNTVGKLIGTSSYNANGIVIQNTQFTYDNFGNVADQIIRFNPDNPIGVDPANEKVSKISYPKYNFRGSLEHEIIDVNNDGTTDFVVFMEYDPLNRLVAIYAAIGELDFSEASLIVSYEYNDEIGTVKKKTHYVEQTNLAAIANEISYEYDQRNRLTNITAKKPGHNPVMDYDLFYDDQVVEYSYGGQQETVTHDQNWNGNINGTSMDYNFNAITAFTAAPNDMIKPLLYGYKYDPINRMTQADATVGDFIQTGSLASQSYQIGDLDVNYDKIGNIISLHRTMLNDANDPINYLAFDHFNYVYGNGNNRLISVQGLSGSAPRNYTYDEMGNLVSDDARDMVSTKYARTAYPYQVTKDNNGDTETIDYLYSIDDQRIYKRLTDNLGTEESYYLKDAFGSTVAIYVNNTSGEEWSYFVSGSERECEITPHGNFTPFTNSGVTYTPDDVAIGVDMIKFYLYDHLGNTRITYTPDKVVTLDEEIVHDDFLYGSFDDWHGEVTTNGDVWVDLENTSNALAVTVEPQAVNGVSKNINYLPGGPFVYDVTIDVDLGSTSGLEMSITNALPNTQTLTQGLNTFTITPSNTNSILSILPTDNSQAHNFTINSMVIEKQNATVFVTQDDINQVVDYYPYGKVLREYVNGDQERYLTTQHERDQATGLDYRGARYYDSDVARFLSLDPLAAQFPNWSAYNYVMGNPVMLVDPDGRAPMTKYENENGDLLAETDDGNDATVTISEENEESFMQEFNKRKLEGTENGMMYNESWIRRYGDGMSFSDGGHVKPWAATATSPDVDLSGLKLATGGLILSGSKEVLSGSTYRLFKSQGSIYSPKLYMSGWSGGSAGNIKTYGTSRLTGIMRLGGYGLGVFNAVSIQEQFEAGNISGFQYGMEQVSNGYSTLGGLPGAAWGVGWELGRGVAQTSAYLDFKFWLQKDVLGRDVQRWQMCTACPR